MGQLLTSSFLFRPAPAEDFVSGLLSPYNLLVLLASCVSLSPLPPLRVSAASRTATNSSHQFAGSICVHQTASSAVTLQSSRGRPVQKGRNSVVQTTAAASIASKADLASRIIVPYSLRLPAIMEFSTWQAGPARWSRSSAVSTFAPSCSVLVSSRLHLDT